MSKKPHPNSLANLVPPPVKGEIRNPKGNNGAGGPKKMRSVLKELMQAPASKHELATLPAHIPHLLAEQLGRKPTRQDLMGLAVMAKAMDGDVQAFNSLMDRVEGKPVQKTQNQNVEINYVEFLKMKKAEIDGENNENPQAETEVFQGQDVGPKESEDY